MKVARQSYWPDDDISQDKEQIYSKIFSQANSGKEQYIVAEALGMLEASYRRQRRWVNEKELRELAGPMTLKQVNSLFSPVPFGEYHMTPFEQIMEPENREAKNTFDRLINVDMDIQGKVFKIWEKQVTSQKLGDVQSQRAVAIARWKTIPQNLKTCLKRADGMIIQETEEELIDKIQDLGDSDNICFTFKNIGSFKFIILQGVCQYYKIKVLNVAEDEITPENQAFLKTQSVKLQIKSKQQFQQQYIYMTFQQMMQLIKGNKEQSNPSPQ